MFDRLNQGFLLGPVLVSISEKNLKLFYKQINKRVFEKVNILACGLFQSQKQWSHHNLKISDFSICCLLK